MGQAGGAGEPLSRAIRSEWCNAALLFLCSHQLSCIAHFATQRLPCRADAVVYTSSTSHERIPATFWLPAVAATLALIFINLISRDDLHNIQESTYGDEHAEVRFFWLCRAPCTPTAQPALTQHLYGCPCSACSMQLVYANVLNACRVVRGCGCCSVTSWLLVRWQAL